MTQDTDRALARLHLDLAHALYTLRVERNLSEEILAERTGLSVDEIGII